MKEHKMSEALMSHSMVENEIKPFELWRIVARRKLIVFIVASIASAAGLTYSLLVTPVYKSEAQLLPPFIKDIQGLGTLTPPPLTRKIQSLEDLKVSAEIKEAGLQKQAYLLFIQNLKSYSQRKYYFDAHNLLGSLGSGDDSRTSAERVFENSFNKALRIEVSKDTKNAFVKVSFEGSDPRLVALWVNGFIAQANKVTVNALVKVIEGRREKNSNLLRERIAGKRKTAEHDRLDKIIKLEEAIYIAEHLANKEGMLFSHMAAGKGAITLIELNMPLYMRGSEALQLELALLRGRKNNDPFTPDLRGLQERLALLAGAGIVDLTKINAVQVDKLALVSGSPIWPRLKVIMLLSLFGGLLLGVFAAFVVELWTREREEKHDLHKSAEIMLV